MGLFLFLMEAGGKPISLHFIFISFSRSFLITIQVHRYLLALSLARLLMFECAFEVI